MRFEVQEGQRLTWERERLGLSQQALAEKCGLARTMLSRYERAAAEPGASSLIALESAGVDVLYVLTGKHVPRTAQALSAESLAMLESYERASAAGRAAFHAVASLASEQAPKAGADQRAGATISIGGDVGQSVAGDQTNTGSISFSVGKRAKP